MNTIIRSRVTRKKNKTVMLPMLTFLISALLISFGANATLVDFDEAIDGDLSNSPSGSGNDFLIDTAGTNKWKGTGFIKFQAVSMTLDLNRFSFTVANGLEITGVSFQLSNTVISNLNQLQNAIYDNTPFRQGKVWETFYDNSGNAIGLPATPITPIYPFDAGDYKFYAQYWGDRTDSSWSWDLEIITSSVSTVPEPGTLVLLGLGLAGIGYRRRQLKAD